MPAELPPKLELALDLRGWRLVTSVRRPVDPNDNLLLYRKAGGE
jgi:hypothetical protein